MTQKCLKCLKYTMCFFNLIFFICGIALFGIGVYLMMNSTNSHISSLIPSLSNILFIIGIIITCVSFLGFLWAMKDNRCLLITYFILLFLLVLVELSAACVLLVYENKIDKVVGEELKASLVESNHERNPSHSTDGWDTIQQMFKCCGVTNVSDWTKSVPDSCCTTTPCASPNKYWKKGCYTELKNWFEDNFLFAGVGMIVLCIIEVLGMCFAMTLIYHKKHEEKCGGASAVVWTPPLS